MTKLEGVTYEANTGCGSLYVTLNNNQDGRLVEVFLRAGKCGACMSSQTESIGRLLSALLREGYPPEKIVKQLRGISCHARSGVGENEVLSCSDAIGQVFQEYLAERKAATGQLELIAA